MRRNVERVLRGLSVFLMVAVGDLKRRMPQDRIGSLVCSLARFLAKLVRECQYDTFWGVILDLGHPIVGPGEAISSDSFSVPLIPLQDFFVDVTAFMVQMYTHCPMANLVRANSKIQQSRT